MCKLLLIKCITGLSHVPQIRIVPMGASRIHKCKTQFIVYVHMWHKGTLSGGIVAAETLEKGTAEKDVCTLLAYKDGGGMAESGGEGLEEMQRRIGVGCNVICDGLKGRQKVFRRNVDVYPCSMYSVARMDASTCHQPVCITCIHRQTHTLAVRMCCQTHV